MYINLYTLCSSYFFHINLPKIVLCVHFQSFNHYLARNETLYIHNIVCILWPTVTPLALHISSLMITLSFSNLIHRHDLRSPPTRCISSLLHLYAFVFQSIDCFVFSVMRGNTVWRSVAIRGDCWGHLFVDDVNAYACVCVLVSVCMHVFVCLYQCVFVCLHSRSAVFKLPV